MQTVGHKSLWQHRWQADGRQAAETGKQAVETGRQAVETGKQTAETGKQAAETGKQAVQTDWQAAETGLTFTTRQESKGGNKSGLWTTGKSHVTASES